MTTPLSLPRPFDIASQPPAARARVRRLARAGCCAALLAAWLAAPLASQQIMETLSGTVVDDSFGRALDNAGDVDGDGIDDLIVGSPTASSDNGSVRLFSGRTGDLIHLFTGSTNAQLGYAVAGIGDMNGDGRSEVAFSAIGESKFEGGVFSYDPVRIWDQAAGAYLFTYWSSDNDDAGYALSGGGDGNGDDLPDLLIGAPLYDTSTLSNAGRVYRLQIAGGVPLVTIMRTGDQAGQQMGFDVAWVGDVLGNGIDHFAVSSPFRDEIGLPGAPDVGRVHVLDGHGNQLWTNKGPNQASGLFGFSVGGGKDLTGDGLPDVVIGAPYYGNNGRVAVYHGPNGAFFGAREGDSSGDLFGWDVAVIDRTGVNSILVGAPGDGEGGGLTDPGVVHRLSSSASLPTVWSYTGDASLGHLGLAIAVLRDMNFDDGEEFAVGQPFPFLPVTNTPGRVQMFCGLNQSAAWSNYGVGLPGTLGVPTLVAQSNPLIPSTTPVHFSNSLGATTFGVVFYGFQTATLPFKGGFLQVTPSFLFNFPMLPPQGVTINVPAADDHSYIGLRIYFQGAQLDPGAVLGVSLTRPLLLNFGL